MSTRIATCLALALFAIPGAASSAEATGEFLKGRWAQDSGCSRDVFSFRPDGTWRNPWEQGKWSIEPGGVIAFRSALRAQVFRFKKAGQDRLRDLSGHQDLVRCAPQYQPGFAKPGAKR